MDEVLTIPKKKFQELLKKTIEKGKLIHESAVQINSFEFVDEIENDYELWDDYNIAFLESSFLFEDNEMIDIYNKGVGYIGMKAIFNNSMPDTENRLNEIAEKTSKQCQNLQKIENRIQFYTENKSVNENDNIEFELFPLEIVENTRGYIENIGKQIILCYNHKLFDACLVMIRKLIETLIIECFEKHKLESVIKDNDSNYFYLGELIEKFKQENSWTLTRNTKQALPNIKKYGDLSAHNRRFCAKRNDIDSLKDDLRIVIEELINIINF